MILSFSKYRNVYFHKGNNLRLQLTRLYRSMTNHEFQYETYKRDNDDNTFISCTLHIYSL